MALLKSGLRLSVSGGLRSSRASIAAPFHFRAVLRSIWPWQVPQIFIEIRVMELDHRSPSRDFVEVTKIVTCVLCVLLAY